MTELCGSCEWPPSIAQIRKAALNLSRGELSQPSSWEAWERVSKLCSGNEIQLSKIESRTLEVIGGTWSVKHSENPDITRSQFLKAYTEFLDRHDRELCAIPQVLQLALEQRPDVTPVERRISEPEQIETGTQQEISEMLRRAGF